MSVAAARRSGAARRPARSRNGWIRRGPSSTVCPAKQSLARRRSPGGRRAARSRSPLPAAATARRWTATGRSRRRAPTADVRSGTARRTSRRARCRRRHRGSPAGAHPEPRAARPCPWRPPVSTCAGPASPLLLRQPSPNSRTSRSSRRPPPGCPGRVGAEELVGSLGVAALQRRRSARLRAGRSRRCRSSGERRAPNCAGPAAAKSTPDPPGPPGLTTSCTDRAVRAAPASLSTAMLDRGAGRLLVVERDPQAGALVLAASRQSSFWLVEAGQPAG